MNLLDGQRSDVSVLGTGALGSAVARALMAARLDVTVWNRTPDNAEALVAEGAHRSETASDAVAASTLVISCLPTYDHVRETLHPTSLQGRIIINLTSGTPEEAGNLQRWVTDQGAGYLDGAAMSGTRLVGEPEALFLYGGPTEDFQRASTVLDVLGRAEHVGADPRATAILDMALLGMNLGALLGFYHATELTSAAGIRPSDFATIASGYLPFVGGLMPVHARQIETGSYPGDDGTLAVMSAAVDHLIGTSRRLGVDPVLHEMIKELIDRGIADGQDDDGIARLASQLRLARDQHGAR